MNRVEFQRVVDFCNNFKNPAVLLDENYRCLYCNKENFLPKGCELSIGKMGDCRRPIRGYTQFRIMINNNFYCCRIMPFSEELYFAEFINSEELFSLMEYTGVDNSLFTFIVSHDSKLSELKYHLDTLNEELKKNESILYDSHFSTIKNLNTLLSLDVMKIKEYIRLINDSDEYQPIDILAITQAIIDRANTILSKANRYIDFYADTTEYFVSSDFRHLVFAVASALQNALLYSPRDCVPIVTLSSSLIGAERYVILTIRNDSSLFVEKGSGNDFCMDFSSQRMGLGIPMIRKFSTKYGGKFDMRNEGSTVLVEIQLPVYIPTSDELNRVECSGYEFGEFGDATIIDLLMKEVVDNYDFDF